MKKFFVLLLVVFFIPVLSFGVTAGEALIAGLLEGTWIENAAHYALMIADNVTSIGHLATQVEYTIKSYERAAKNLASIGDVKSWDDFWEWNNRQLYLERMSEEALLGMNVTIGKKNYSIYDIDGMASGFDETYVKYWEGEFSPEQREEMWRSLGLTPANYAYVQTWKAREEELARQFLAGTAVQNAEYMENMKNANEILVRLAADRDIGEMDDKEMQAMIIELLAAANKTLSGIALDNARLNELMEVRERLHNTPADAPLLADWPEDAFGPSDTIIER